MGFIADLPNCRLDLEDDREILDKLKPDFRPASNLVTFPMAPFTASFRFKFEPKHGTPAQTGSCRVGLVQNVLYESRRFEYADGTKKKLEYTKDVVDCGDAAAFPFYNAPGVVSRKMGSVTEEMVPFRWITYNQRGFGESLPGHAVGENLRVLPYADVSLVDQPEFKLKLRRTTNAALLTEAMQILTFRIWLVVLPSDSQPTQVLAYTDPFSLMYTCTLTTRGRLLTTGTPDARFRVASNKGQARSIHDFRNLAGPGIHPGKGPAAPMLKGGTEARDRQWENMFHSL